MHALAVIHRDVKLENIFIGGAGDLKLGDFGLTMSMKQEAAISPVGTVEYMSPEVGVIATEFEGCFSFTLQDHRVEDWICCAAV